jgi:PAS domain S-box-containing protein
MAAGSKPGLSKGLRREERLSGCKPVTVHGQDIYGNPFSQNTFTVEMSAAGARLQGLPPVLKDSVLILECGGKQARYRVVWVGEHEPRLKGHVGLHCLDADQSIFGIQSPAAGSFFDEYRRVEAELHRSEDRYRRLFENSLGLICTHDLNGELLSMNPAAASALGYEMHARRGRNLAEFLAPSVRGQFPDYLHRIRAHGQDSGYMLVVARDHTKHVWLYRNLLVSDGGSPPYVIGHAMDVTEQKRVEYQLQSALKQLQKAAAEVRTLEGLLPICAWCKKIRTEKGNWIELESYITAHSEANFSHGVCPDCIPRV